MRLETVREMVIAPIFSSSLLFFISEADWIVSCVYIVVVRGNEIAHQHLLFLSLFAWMNSMNSSRGSKKQKVKKWGKKGKRERRSSMNKT